MYVFSEMHILTHQTDIDAIQYVNVYKIIIIQNGYKNQTEIGKSQYSASPEPNEFPHRIRFRVLTQIKMREQRAEYIFVPFFLIFPLLSSFFFCYFLCKFHCKYVYAYFVIARRATITIIMYIC